jgi:hypothetical protein
VAVFLPYNQNHIAMRQLMLKIKRNIHPGSPAPMACISLTDLSQYPASRIFQYPVPVPTEQ